MNKIEIRLLFVDKVKSVTGTNQVCEYLCEDYSTSYLSIISLNFFFVLMEIIKNRIHNTLNTSNLTKRG